MKKLLSIILATAMVLSLIPATFATEGEVSGENLKIVYSFGQAYYGGSNNDGYLPEDLISYTNSGEKISYVTHTYESGDQCFWNSANLCLYGNSGNYATFKIRVPKAGSYNLTYEFLKKSTARSYMYIIDDLTDISASGNSSLVRLEVPNDDSNATGTGIVTGQFVANRSGEFLFVVKSRDTGYNRPVSLTLSMGENASEVAVMGPTEENLAKGATKNISYGSSTDTELTNVTFKTSDSTVATVDETGLVTANSVGEAIITTSAEGAYSLETKITVTDPTKPTIKYDFTIGLQDTSIDWIDMADVKDKLSYNYTHGFYACYDLLRINNETLQPYTNRQTYLQLQPAGYISFLIKVPVTGDYKLMAEYPKVNNGINAYVLISELDEYEGLTSVNSYKTAKFVYTCDDDNKTYAHGSNRVVDGKTYSTESIRFEADTEYVLTFLNAANGSSKGYPAIAIFSLVSGTGNALVGHLSGDTTLEVSESVTLKGYLSSNGDVAAVTYESSNDCVTVDKDGTITATKPGKATVTMTADAGVATAGNIYSVEITVPGDAPEYIALGVSDNVNKKITVKGTDYTRGQEVTVAAPEISGKIFRHWVLGTEEKGKVVSTKAEYTFPLMTNTYLTAVYTDKPAEGAKLVEFFNWNGDYLSQSVLGENNSYSAPTPSLIGFRFNNAWLVDENKYLSEMTEFGEVTRAVAEFTALDGFTVAGQIVSYDDEIKEKADEEVAWYRDGVLVGYGQEYTYNVWNTVGEITSGSFSEKAPVVVLDAHIKEGNACMIEYDNGGKTIKEVGILFGTADATVDSADSKATSQWNEAHGQFTAKPRTEGNATHARGYIIYEDGEDYKVIYTDAKPLTGAAE